MRACLALALWALLPAAATAAVPLQALGEGDVGAEALENSACYAHDGPAVLVVATRKNAVVNSEGDLLLLERLGDDGAPGGGARYGSDRFEVVIAPSPGPAGPKASDGRTHQPARISVRTGKNVSNGTVRWACGS
ncbi:MAG: hypothetical protein WBR13_15790 [Allosphingosinicella sp.]